MLKDYWKKAILENVPHGEDGNLQVREEDILDFIKILLKYGNAVCITGGDFEDMYKISWFYAGGDNADWADYNMVAFFNQDYLDDYPQALYEQVEEYEAKQWDLEYSIDD